MALRLSRLFGHSTEFWLNAQRAVDLWDAAQALKDEMAHSKPLRVAYRMLLQTEAVQAMSIMLKGVGVDPLPNCKRDIKSGCPAILAVPLAWPERANQGHRLRTQEQTWGSSRARPPSQGTRPLQRGPIAVGGRWHPTPQSAKETFDQSCDGTR